MPMIPVGVDPSTLIVTSVLSGGLTFVFCTVAMEVKLGVAAGIGLAVGALLYLTGIVPIGLLLIVGIGMILAIGRGLVSSGDTQPSEVGPSSVQYYENPVHSQGAPDIVNESFSRNGSAVLPPYAVGGLIAKSLDVSCGLSNISADEREFVRDSGITIAQYRDEMIFLAAFAQDYAISTLLGRSDLRAEVIRGYREAWESIARQSGAGRVRYERFVQRSSVYAEAVADLGLGSVSTIAVAFGGFLGAENPKVQLLALSFADGIFYSHFEGVKYSLQKALVLPVSDGS